MYIHKIYNDSKRQIYDDPDNKNKYIDICKFYLSVIERKENSLKDLGYKIKFNIEIEKELLKRLKTINLNELIQ